MYNILNLIKINNMFALYKLASISTALFLMLSSCSNLNSIQTTVYEISEKDTARKESNSEIIYRNDIPIKVVRSFINEFTENENVQWRKTEADLFVAKFATDSTEKKIDYNRNGTWNHVWTSYNKIPAAILELVDKKFCCYSIANVYGLLVPSDKINIVYSVLIKHDNNCMALKIYKGQMEILSDFESEE
jgi:hypothetical protein